MKTKLYIIVTIALILSACQSAVVTLTSPPPLQTLPRPKLTETSEPTATSALTPTVTASSTHIPPSPTPSLTASPVRAPTVIAQTGVELYYETLFAIPVREGSVQYWGGDNPDMEINGPNAIAVLPDGSFAVADLVGNRLWRYDSTGQLIKSIDLYSVGIEMVADLRATSTEFFVLEIRAERYRVNRLSFDGDLKASYDIPKGFHIENGLTGIAVDCEGEVLLELAGGSDLYCLVDAQGNLNPASVSGDYHCNGKSYRVIYPGSGKPPNIIAGSIRLETQLTTGLGGFRLLDVLQDGSFYVIREDVVNDQVIKVDQTVHYIGADGVQQGVARVPIAENCYPKCGIWQSVQMGTCMPYYLNPIPFTSYA